MRRNILNSSWIVFVLLSVIIDPCFTLGAVSVPVGPGVAGQIHALEFDADDSQKIYVGGDRFGVYYTNDLGLSWRPSNNGLENRHGGDSMYVEDILVIGAGQSAGGASRQYAATHGGIYHRSDSGSTWELQTPPSEYGYGYQKGGMLYEKIVWYSTLAYDGNNNIYAGAGHARYENDYTLSEIYTHVPRVDFTPPDPAYPEQYSLWKKMCRSYPEGDTAWLPVELSANKGSVRQIDCYYDSQNAISYTAFSTSTGVHVISDGIGDPEITTLTTQDKVSSIPNWSGNCWGVAFDHLGRLFVLNHRGGSVGQWPGVYWIDVLDGVEFAEVGDEEGYIEVGEGPSITWSAFREDDEIDLSTLSLRVDEAGLVDIIVGNRDGISGVPSQGGGFLHISIPAAIDPGNAIWDNMLRYSKWGDLETKSLISSVTTTMTGDQLGWLDDLDEDGDNGDAQLSPTVEFGFSPHDSHTVLAWLYHIPLLSENGGDSWEQVYCDQAADRYWKGRGCSEMGVRGISHLSDGRVVVAAADWDGWLEGQGDGSFMKMFENQNLSFHRVETYIDDELSPEYVYVIINTGLSSESPVHSLLARRTDFSSANDALWEELGHYNAPNISGVDHYLQDFVINDKDGRVFAIAIDNTWTGEGKFQSTIIMGIPPSAENPSWIWRMLFPLYDIRYSDLVMLPASNKLIISHMDTNTPASGGVLCYDLSLIPQDPDELPQLVYPEEWLVGVRGGNVLHRAARMGNTLAVDANESVLYVGSIGERTYFSESTQGAGSVLRLHGPFIDTEAPEESRWEVLANDGYDTFSIGSHAFHQSGYPVWDWTTTTDETAQRMTYINDLVVDPWNPEVVYAAVDATNMHPSNGVWRLIGDSWSQILGGNTQDPSQPPACMSISPVDDRELAVGMKGQELYKLTLDPVIKINSLTRYFDKSSQVSESDGLSYTGTPYASLSFDYDANPVDDTVYDTEERDILVTSMDGPSKLFRNMGVLYGGVDEYEGVPDYADYTFIANLDIGSPAFRGIASGDYDNDGWVDIFIAHKTLPRLYHNIGLNGVDVKYEDVTDILGPASLLYDSWTASWCDFNRDGYLDLFVGRGTSDAVNPLDATNMTGLSDVLLENRTWCNEGFVDVSDLLPHEEGDEICTVSASWADVNGDGWFDLFAWDPAINLGADESSRSRLWINQQGESFTEEFQSRFAVPSPHGLNSATVRNLSGNRNPDVILCTDTELSVRYNSMYGAYPSDTALLQGTGLELSSALVYDHDLDGSLDILTLTNANNKTSQLLMGDDPGPGVIQFIDVTDEIGLDESGPCMTAQGIDVTGDGDPDLYIGKQTIPGERYYFQNKNLFENDEPLNHWYGIRLVGDGGTNVSGYGSEIVLEFNDQTIYHTVSPEWGLGSSTGGVVIIGVGVDKALSSAHVNWPDGTTQSFSPEGNGVVTVVDNIQPEYVSQSLVASYVGLPGGELNLVFEWETNNAVDPARTQVTLTSLSGVGCNVFPSTLTPNSYLSDYQVSMNADGIYQHRFEWSGDCVTVCYYNAQIECFTNSGSFVTEARLLKIRTCLGGFPF